MTRVLWVVPEIHPWATAGGLGEVTAGLPDAIAKCGVDVELVAPYYPSLRAVAPDPASGPEHQVGIASHRIPLRLVRTRTPTGRTLHLVDAPGWLDRSGIYGDPTGPYPDNAVRFGLLAAGALELLREGGYDLLHGHDWPGAIAVAALAAARPHEPDLASVRSLLTVHNLAHTHPCDAHDLGFPEASANRPWDPLEAGLIHADRLTTVSPSYARAMREGSLGYAEVFAGREDPVHGILNAIDPRDWDPSRDPHLASPFDAAHPEGRERCRDAFRAEWGLPAAGPVFGFAARFVEQKGVDLLLAATPRVLAAGAHLAWLGDGDPGLEAQVLASADAHPGRIAVRIPFDRPTLHRFLAGIDALVMPSRLEPCGLTQLQALRLGAPVVASRVGGLADTLGGLEHAAFLYRPNIVEALAGTLEAVVDAYSDRPGWQARIREGMAQEIGWTRAASRYAELYEATRALAPASPPPVGPRFRPPPSGPRTPHRGFVHLLVRSPEQLMVQWARTEDSPARLRLREGDRTTALPTVAGPVGHAWIEVRGTLPVQVELVSGRETLRSNRVVPGPRPTGPDLPSS